MLVILKKRNRLLGISTQGESHESRIYLLLVRWFDGDIYSALHRFQFAQKTFGASSQARRVHHSMLTSIVNIGNGIGLSPPAASSDLSMPYSRLWPTRSGCSFDP